MKSKKPEERIKELESELRNVRAEYEQLLDSMEDYYIRAAHSECNPMEGEAVVSLNTIDGWCRLYAGHSLIEAQDYFNAVGIRNDALTLPLASFANASMLARKLWVYVSSYMNGGPDFLFWDAKVYLQRATEERLRSDKWVEQRKQALEQLLELEKQFIALANINASLPENDADLHLAVVEEMLLDANDKTVYDIKHTEGNIQEIMLLIELMKREIDRAAHSINAFDTKHIVTAAAGNSLIDGKYVDYSVLESLGLFVATHDE